MAEVNSTVKAWIKPCCNHAISTTLGYNPECTHLNGTMTVDGRVDVAGERHDVRRLRLGVQAGRLQGQHFRVSLARLSVPRRRIHETSRGCAHMVKGRDAHTRLVLDHDVLEDGHGG